MALRWASVWNRGLEQLVNGLLKINLLTPHPPPPHHQKNQNVTVFPIATGKAEN